MELTASLSILSPESCLKVPVGSSPMLLRVRSSCSRLTRGPSATTPPRVWKINQQSLYRICTVIEVSFSLPVLYNLYGYSLRFITACKPCEEMYCTTLLQAHWAICPIYNNYVVEGSIPYLKISYLNKIIMKHQCPQLGQVPQGICRHLHQEV